MNRWLQTREFTCPDCKAVYLHDRGHAHSRYQCPERHEPVKLKRCADLLNSSQITALTCTT